MRTFASIFFLACLAAWPVTAAHAGSPFFYVRVGAHEDSQVPPRFGIAMLGGGEELHAAFRWLVGLARGGDMLVIRANGADADDYTSYLWAMGGLNSVAVLDVRSEDANKSPLVLNAIRRAECIFFAGGDQALYVRYFRNKAIGREIQAAVGRGVPVGGTSAGLAILGQYYFGALNDTVSSSETLLNPYDFRVTVGDAFLVVPYLKNVLTDTHFMERDRMGRLVTFLARLRQDRRAADPVGFGVDEACAVLVDRSGQARIVGTGAAYVVKLRHDPQFCRAGRPLQSHPVDIAMLPAGSSLDLVGTLAHPPFNRVGVASAGAFRMAPSLRSFGR
jgi:cyanophycinase